MKKSVFAFLLMLLASFMAYLVWAECQYLAEPGDVLSHLNQLNEHDSSLSELKRQAEHRNALRLFAPSVIGGVSIMLAICLLIPLTHEQKRDKQIEKFASDFNAMKKHVFGAVSVLLLVTFSGCYAPFEPVQLEVIQSNEYAFMLPFTEDAAKQTKSANEEYLRKNMVFAKQVKIPQQWVATGFSNYGRNSSNGAWKPAALLLKVTNSPVTREWTADPMSGTSKRNEAVWVMTSDQVEFSTGWSCTGRIASEDDAVKFLHNYPLGTLEHVLDSEVRMKLATEFALEVTDLPMEKLRRDATPHIKRVVVTVQEFFGERGISITNLGITGGFVYKDASVQEMLVKVFNAEQQKSLAQAATQAQEETNKKVQLEASGKAEARLTEAEAEAKAIKLVAEAKAFELEKAKDNIEVYLSLKRLEIEAKKVEKWEGKFPHTYFGTKPPEMLLNVPDSK